VDVACEYYACIPYVTNVHPISPTECEDIRNGWSPALTSHADRLEVHSIFETLDFPSDLCSIGTHHSMHL
jgi:hypothetical protein